jgi:hypothetical protein
MVDFGFFFCGRQKHICCYQRIFIVIQLGKSHSCKSIYKDLLIDFTGFFYIANVIDVLRTLISGMMRFYLSTTFLFFFFAFQVGYLAGCKSHSFPEITWLPGPSIAFAWFEDRDGAIHNGYLQVIR